MNGGFVGELKNLPVWQIIGEEIRGIQFTWTQILLEKFQTQTHPKHASEVQNTETEHRTLHKTIFESTPSTTRHPLYYQHTT